MTAKEKEELTTPEHAAWGKPLEFILSCLGYAVGLGNVWRFPYLCYRNGGGAFLIAYFIMALLMGIPIFLLELIIGQYSGLGPNQAFRNLAPIFNGVGYCTLILMYYGIINYMVLIAWTLFYFFASFTSELGFGSCLHDFNTIGCYSAKEDSSCSSDETYYNKTCMKVERLCQIYLDPTASAANRTSCVSENGTRVPIDKIITRTLATAEYFRDYVLGIKEATWENFGGINWELLACLLLAWILGYLCVVKGIKTIAKASYFTALFPYVTLTALVVQGTILEGSEDGIRLYLQPQWEKLGEVKVWAEATSQVFYSFGIACGSLISLASYNNFYNNCITDVLIVSLTNVLTSLYAGFAIFGMLGFLAQQMGVPVEEVATDGPGLAFVAYPEAILRLPAPTVWALLFFFMLFVLGIGCQLPAVLAISCLIVDKWPHLTKYQIYITLGICISCFILGIPMCFGGGVYLFTLMEWHTSSYVVFLLALFEVILVAWIYGANRFIHNMSSMKMNLSKISVWFWWSCWTIFTPASLIGILIFQIMHFSGTYYEDYIFPVWANSIGWLIGLSTLVPILMFGAYTVWKKEYTGWELIQPTVRWNPQSKKDDIDILTNKA